MPVVIHVGGESASNILTSESFIEQQYVNISSSIHSTAKNVAAILHHRDGYGCIRRHHHCSGYGIEFQGKARHNQTVGIIVSRRPLLNNLFFQDQLDPEPLDCLRHKHRSPDQVRRRPPILFQPYSERAFQRCGYRNPGHGDYPRSSRWFSWPTNSTVLGNARQPRIFVFLEFCQQL
jgi:hypothetical protein